MPFSAKDSENGGPVLPSHATPRSPLSRTRTPGQTRSKPEGSATLHWLNLLRGDVFFGGWADLLKGQMTEGYYEAEKFGYTLCCGSGASKQDRICAPVVEAEGGTGGTPRL